jgi:CxxC motif-containing protein (DUF1111 family)
MKHSSILFVASLGFLTSAFLPADSVDVCDPVPPVPPVGAAGGPSQALSPEDEAQWLRGRAVFDRAFHKSDGLGTPEYNADSCRACHQDPAIGGSGGLELNVSRFANDNGGVGPFTDLPGGQVVSKFRPPYVGGREEHDMTADVFEQRQTPTIFGGGLIDSISDIEVLSNEDPLDLDTNGILGVAHVIPVAGGGMEVGKFGWKNQIPKMRDFVRDAMAGECGMSTPDDGRGFGLSGDGDPTPDPELTPQQFDDILFFLLNLAAPARGGSLDPDVALGEGLFDTVGCAICHIPTLQGAGGPVPLYSDLLLHNVMPAGFRGMSEPGAGVGFFGTAPLWGIKDTAPNMHDGHAETIEESILAHDGEAAGVTAAYVGLSPADKARLILFLEDL